MNTLNARPVKKALTLNDIRTSQSDGVSHRNIERKMMGANLISDYYELTDNDCMEICFFPREQPIEVSTSSRELMSIGVDRLDMEVDFKGGGDTWLRMNQFLERLVNENVDEFITILKGADVSTTDITYDDGFDLGYENYLEPEENAEQAVEQWVMMKKLASG